MGKFEVKVPPLLFSMVVSLLFLLTIVKATSPTSGYKNEMNLSQTAGPEGYDDTKEILVKETTDLIKEGDSALKLSMKHKSAILVLGVTGAGKTTMTQLISGNNTAMISYEPEPDSENFLIRDEHQLISEANVISQTIFPILVIDNESDQAIYDCPGFADTRSVPIEIANTYFIKRIVDHHDEIKILLVVNYNSVRPGYNRNQFLLLVDYLLQFLKEPTNYERSIAMLVTKVNTRQSDPAVKRTVGAFLQKLLTEINNVEFKHPTENFRLILRALLHVEGRSYSNIQIFRQPEEPGRLSEIASVQENRNRIRNMVFSNPSFRYQVKGSSSFGFSLSSNARLMIFSLLHKTKDQVQVSLENLYQALTSQYEDYSKVQESLNETNSSFQRLQEVLSDKMWYSNATDLLSAYQMALVNIGISPPQLIFASVENNLQFIKFLENMQPFNTDSEDVSAAVVSRLLETLASATDAFGSIHVKHFLQRFPAALLSSYDKKLEETDSIEHLQEDVAETIQSFENLLRDCTNLELSATIDRICNQSLAGDIISEYPVAEVLNFAKNFDTFHQSLLRSGTLRHSGNTIIVKEALVKVVERFLNGVKTYERLFDRLDPALKAFLSGGRSNDLIRNLDDLEMPANRTKRKVLHDLAVVINSETSLRNESSFSIIEGHVISASGVQRFLNSTAPGTCVVLMSTTAVKIDTDIVLPGQSLYIFAPQVITVGARKISVDGLPGHSYDKAANQGLEGAAGGPGGAGGLIVISTVDMFINGTLELSANGGNGGTGQEGGAGAKGANGADLLNHQVQRAGMTDINAPFGKTYIGCCKKKWNKCRCGHFKAHSQPGKPGSNGGRGGRGGQGGGAGDIKIFFRNNTMLTNLQLFKEPGNAGRGGPGGKRGYGGINGRSLMAIRHHDRKTNKAGEGAAWGSIIPILGTIIGAAVGASQPRIEIGKLIIHHDPSWVPVRASNGDVGPAGLPGLDAPNEGFNASCTYNLTELHEKYMRFLNVSHRNLFLYTKIQQYVDAAPFNDES